MKTNVSRQTLGFFAVVFIFIKHVEKQIKF